MKVDEVVQRLYAKAEELKEVHTREDLDRVNAELVILKNRALKESPEYQQQVLLRRAEAERKAEMARLRMQPRINEVKMRADKARSEAEVMRNQIMLTTRMKRFDVASFKKKDGDAEWSCPKCGSTNASNTMSRGKRRVPWCFKCNVPLKKKDEFYSRNVDRSEYLEEALKRMGRVV